MLLTIIVLYSFIVRCLKRENKLITSGKSSCTDYQSASNSVSSNSIATNSTSSSTTNSIAYNHLSKNHHHYHPHHHKDSTVINLDKEEDCDTEILNRGNKEIKDNPNDSSKEADSDDEVADDNQFDEEEFYNIIATKAAAFQSKRNSSTSTVSSGSMYDDTYRTKRHSLRSQSSTCSDIMETSVISTTRRSSEESCRLQNRKLNYKSRRHGFTTLSKRRRTTGRYFLILLPTCNFLFL
jgi:hypothetical protein